MAIDDDFIKTSVWTDIRGVLVSASIIGSTVSGSVSSTSSASIVGEYSDEHKNKPQVVIHPVVLSEADFKFGGTYGKRTLNVPIECFHSNGKALDYMDDMVSRTLANSTPSGLSLVSVESATDFGTPADNKVKSRMTVFTFTRE